MAIQLQHNIDTIQSTIGNLSITPNVNIATALTVNNIDIGTGLQNAYNTANGAFARANSGGGTGGQITFIVDPVHPGLTVNSGSVITITGNNSLILGMNVASTTVAGVVELNDTVQSTSTTLAATANSVNTTWAYAQSAFIQANSFSSIVSTIGGTANSAQNLALSAFSEANSFQSVINSAFIHANSHDSIISTIGTTANSGQNLALSAFAEANSFQSVINSAFTQANSYTNIISTIGTTANTLATQLDPANNVINLGGQANTHGTGSKVSYANGSFANTGDAQWSITLLRNQSNSSANTINLSTTGANVTTSVYGSINQLQLANNAVYAFSAMVVARDITNMFSKIWEVKGGIKNVVGARNTTPVSNTNIMGSPVINIIAADNGTNNWTLALSTDLANNALLFLGSGSANTTNWVARVDTTEVA